MTRLDPRSPMVLDTQLVGRRAGSMHEVSRQIEAPDEFGTDVIAVAPGDPLVVEVRMESVVEGVLVTGSVRATATGACVRCLDPVTQEVRDTVVPALPFQPVCRPDCLGLCSECGQPLTEDPEHHHDVIDPRWAALSALAEQPAETERRT